ncbi:MAG TPA: hypothetical protein VMH20_19420 [Verrucomicrobiae bacterium]|nr:hypothetical protein [Verrucomicrobiae bacterium]
MSTLAAIPKQLATPTLTERLPAGPWLLTMAVMLATFMEVLDTTVVNVSLTHIAGSLSATPTEATWAIHQKAPRNRQASLLASLNHRITYSTRYTR